MSGPDAPDGGCAELRAAVVAAARSGFLGKLAVEVGLEHALDNVFDRPGHVEREIWRAAQAELVMGASPIALDLLAGEGMDPSKASRRITPNGPWPAWLCGPRPLLARSFARRWKRASAPPRDERHDRLAFLEGGLVLRRRDNPSGALGVRLSGGALNVGARIGPVWIRTNGALAVADPLPAVLLAACAGRPLDRLLDHPVVRARGYEILCEAAPPPRQAWALLVRTGVSPWRVPWRADAGATR